MKIWIARKQDNKLLALTEKEALVHFKHNNISTRMKLEFLGVSDGQAYLQERARLLKENEDKINSMYVEGVPESPLLTKLKDDIEQQALEKEGEVAKANGVVEPNRDLDIMMSFKGVDAQSEQKARKNLTNMVR